MERRSVIEAGTVFLSASGNCLRLTDGALGRMGTGSLVEDDESPAPVVTTAAATSRPDSQHTEPAFRNRTVRVDVTIFRRPNGQGRKRRISAALAHKHINPAVRP